MKKIITILLLTVGLHVSAMAQDTIYNRIPGGWYPQWYDECDQFFTPRVVDGEKYGRFCLVRYGAESVSGYTIVKVAHTDEPIAVNGISVMVVDAPVPRLHILDTTYTTEYALLYQGLGNDINSKVVLDSVRWDTAARKVLKLPQMDDTSTFGFFYTNLYQARFNSPVIVDSTFYVGSTAYSCIVYTSGPYSGMNPHKPFSFTLVLPLGRDTCGVYDSVYIGDPTSTIPWSIWYPIRERRYGMFIPMVDYAMLEVESADSTLGSVSESGSHSIHIGWDIRAYPARGCSFSHWNDGSTDNPRTVYLMQDTLFTAYFSRDTIDETEPTYYYNFWLDSADIAYYSGTDSCAVALDSSSAACEVASYNYTDSTLRIAGVAAAIFSPGADSAAAADSSWNGHMRLYKNTGTGMTMLAEKPCAVLDTSRWMTVYNPAPTGTARRVLPVFEAYFDQPVEVADSFYVSVTGSHACAGPAAQSSPGSRAVPYGYNTVINQQAGQPVTHCFGRNSMCVGADDSLWHHGPDDAIFFIFPIIDTMPPQPYCHVVTGLAGDAVDSTAERLSWRRGNANHSWQVAYGPADGRAFWALFDTPDTVVVLTGLTPGREYAACVRALCADTVHYSDWSDTLRFTAPDTTVSDTTQGITPVAAPQITLHPNPATGKVTVQGLDEAPQAIEIFDMTGRLAAAFRRTAKIDVSALPSGSYIVKLQTADGQVQHLKLVKK